MSDGLYDAVPGPKKIYYFNILAVDFCNAHMIPRSNGPFFLVDYVLTWIIDFNYYYYFLKRIVLFE